MKSETFWLLFGFSAQAMFFCRFLVQWVASERAKESVMPTSFWFLSLAGGLLLFIYAAVRKDPVFMFGQGSGLVIYIRNLMLIFKKQTREAANE